MPGGIKKSYLPFRNAFQLKNKLKYSKFKVSGEERKYVKRGIILQNNKMIIYPSEKD
jgi:hypothetical protein